MKQGANLIPISSHHSLRKNFSNKNKYFKVFIQVFIISMLNTSDGIAYAYIMNHPDHGMLPAMIAHFSWY